MILPSKGWFTLISKSVCLTYKQFGFYTFFQLLTSIGPYWSHFFKSLHTVASPSILAKQLISPQHFVHVSKLACSCLNQTFFFNFFSRKLYFNYKIRKIYFSLLKTNQKFMFSISLHIVILLEQNERLKQKILKFCCSNDDKTPTTTCTVEYNHFNCTEL